MYTKENERIPLKMKKRIEWLNELNETFRSRAIANTPKEKHDDECKSMGDALRGFNWSKSKQGYQFWKLVEDNH